MRLLFPLFLLVTAVGCAGARASSAPSSGGEVGVASFYSDALAGRPTASGEPYRPEAATCAHKTLPLGTRVRVTRLDNRRSVTCRVNDRGPFVRGRVVDLSRRGARELGILHQGVARVRVVVIEKPRRRPRGEG